MKNSLAVSQRAIEVGMFFSSRRKFHDCDVMIYPEELSRFGSFDTKHMEEIFEIGYRDARERMDEIRRAIATGGDARAAAHR